MQTLLAGHVTQKRESAREVNTEVAASRDCGSVHSHLDGFGYCACGHLIAHTQVLYALPETQLKKSGSWKTLFVDVDGPDFIVFNGFTKTGLRTRRPGHDGGRALRERHAV